MPKQKITKEMVVEAAFSLAREGGMERVLVKDIAQRLGCSVQPIYSTCGDMEGVRREVAARADDFIRDYVSARLEPGRLFFSMGQAYVSLAREEPGLFSLFLTRERAGIASLDDLYRRETSPAVAQAIAADLGVSPERARALHLHMLIYTMGIAAILSTCRPGLPAQEILAQQESAYQAFLAQIQTEEGIQ